MGRYPFRHRNLILGAIFPLLLVGCGHLDNPEGNRNGDMALIAAAGKTYTQGRTNTGSLKRRQVTLTRNFRMDRHEVTRMEYAERMGLPRPPEDSLLMPMTEVDWYDAVLYCNRRSKADGLDSVYDYSGDTTICTYREQDRCWISASIPRNIVINLDRPGYRLPTLAEWEFACTGGTSTLYYWGDSESDYDRFEWAKQGATASTRAPMHPVGLKLANPFGLFDIMGNANEWANDGAHDPRDSLPATDPLRFTWNGTYYMAAGVSGPGNTLAYGSYSSTPATGRLWSDTGFRCVRTVMD